MSLTLDNPTLSSTPMRLTLQAEAAGVFALILYAYALLGGTWGIFALLLLAPDLFMVGYLFGPRIGGICYNFGHTYLIPLTLGALAHAAGADMLLKIAVIWTAHIAMDRMIGYGLKYFSGFRSTHLQRV